MLENEVALQPTHHRPHNVIALQMRQHDSDIANGWSQHSLAGSIDSVVFAGQFAVIIAMKAMVIVKDAAINHLSGSGEW
jgi:hypothetical protein